MYVSSLFDRKKSTRDAHSLQETIDSHSEFGDEVHTALSAIELNTLGDISPEAL